MTPGIALAKFLACKNPKNTSNAKTACGTRALRRSRALIVDKPFVVTIGSSVVETAGGYVMAVHNRMTSRIQP
jgi:hypothetical protein